MASTDSQPTDDSRLMPQPGNRPPLDCPGEHRSISRCPWCHSDPIYPEHPVRSVRVHFTVGRDRDLGYCGVRGEQTVMTGEINCSDCNAKLDEAAGI